MSDNQLSFNDFLVAHPKGRQLFVEYVGFRCCLIAIKVLKEIYGIDSFSSANAADHAAQLEN